MARCCQDMDQIFDGIDFAEAEGVMRFAKRVRQLRDSVEWPEVFAEIDDEICPEKRRYSKGERTLAPYGYYNPSEAMVLATTNVSRGRLLKKADDPSYIYDYDCEGRVIRISHMHSYEHLRDKASELTYCLYSGVNEVIVSWHPDYKDESAPARFRYLYSMTFHIKDAGGNTLYICHSTVMPLRPEIVSDIEVYGPIMDDVQKMDRFWNCANPEADVSGISVQHFRIEYDENGRMKKCGCGGTERIADYPQELLWDKSLIINRASD
ncbi:MAG: hypothetical protein IJE08_07650 [Clostridia bacterium]|nr:hypothetical protein [Clostridia bacterium]